ncbi:uncharacterized protein TNCV_1826941 [Trichonephila clavipes]|nr:uncharacterized protein TNCV_1826941 [Trichonephila clavipes]
MFDPSSFANPTPLAHADTSRVVLLRGGTSQWRPTRFNLYDPEMRDARGFNVWLELYFSGSENVTEFFNADTITANYTQFWFRRFRSDIFDVKDAPLTGRPVIENVDKITERIEVDRHVSRRCIGQELKIDHKTV